ncbi:DMT family transporter [Kangiella sp. HD9-110m-PIT-SAG07]|nr:DMT family transporter [Kangiella sp. HD9-110m-PIT-SAG07]
MYKNVQKHLAMIGLISAIVLWAASFVAMKYAIAEFGPILTVFLRMILAAAVLIFFLPPMAKKQQYQKGDWWLLLLLALCEPCLYFIFESYALTYTTASEAGMITSLQPIMVAVAAYYLLKEKLNSRLIVGCLMAVVGVVWLTLSGESSEHASNPMLGNALEFGAITAAAAYCLLARKLSQRYSPVFLTLLQMIMGTIFFLPFLLVQDTVIPTDVSAEGIIAILFLAFGVNIFAFTCYNFAFKTMPASKVGSMMNLLPIGTLFFGWLILDEQLNGTQYMAAGLVLLGVIWSQTKPRSTVFVEHYVVRKSMRERAKRKFLKRFGLNKSQAKVEDEVKP